MNNRTLQAFRLFVSAAAVVAALLPGAAFAQGGGGGGFDPANMPPEMRAAMEKMRKFRDQNKQVFALGQTVRALPEIDKDPKTKFTSAQAKTMLTVINKWKTKPSLTNEQATQVNKDLTKAMTIPQIKKLAAEASRRGSWGGGRGGQGSGGGRPGGQGGAPGGGGGRPGGAGGGTWRMPEPKPFNPLNPATSFGRNPEMAKKRMADLTAALTARAAGK